MEIDVDHLRSWIGRTETATDLVTVRLANGLQATLGDPPLEEGDAAPPAIQWCLAPPMVPAAEIGPDGHPARGGFLPPVPLPRRMWAGGSLRFHAPILVGDQVERRSRIADVTVKAGRTGTLCFVAVDHEYVTPRGLAVAERHDIVYRDAATGPARTAPVETPAPQWRESVMADPVLLFRYSALTFNGHRIHYDRRYAMEVEGYDGLIVHGPLQATLLLRLAGRVKERPPASFSFRGVNPLFDGGAFTVAAAETADGLRLWTARASGEATMIADAVWS